jgi:hypothetical protein
MTFLDARNRIETELTDLGLRDRWGDPIEGIEASGIVANAIGQEWDAAVDALGRGEITSDDYCSRILVFIQRFAVQRFSARVDKHLAGLKREQIELGLIPKTASAMKMSGEDLSHERPRAVKEQ